MGNEAHLLEKDALKLKHEEEFQKLEKDPSISPDELAQRKTELFNTQQMEAAALEKRHAEAKRVSQKKAVGDWELRFAQSKMKMKETHYQEFAEYLTELSPDQASEHQKSIAQAHEAAQELARLRENLE